MTSSRQQEVDGALKFIDVDACVLEAPGDYGVIEGVDSHGPKYTCIIRVATDRGSEG